MSETQTVVTGFDTGYYDNSDPGLEAGASENHGKTEKPENSDPENSEKIEDWFLPLHSLVVANADKVRLWPWAGAEMPLSKSMWSLGEVTPDQVPGIMSQIHELLAEPAPENDTEKEEKSEDEPKEEAAKTEEAAKEDNSNEKVSDKSKEPNQKKADETEAQKAQLDSKPKDVEAQSQKEGVEEEPEQTTSEVQQATLPTKTAENATKTEAKVATNSVKSKLTQSSQNKTKAEAATSSPSNFPNAKSGDSKATSEASAVSRPRMESHLQTTHVGPNAESKTTEHRDAPSKKADKKTLTMASARESVAAAFEAAENPNKRPAKLETNDQKSAPTSIQSSDGPEKIPLAVVPDANPGTAPEPRIAVQEVAEIEELDEPVAEYENRLDLDQTLENDEPDVFDLPVEVTVEEESKVDEQGLAEISEIESLEAELEEVSLGGIIEDESNEESAAVSETVALEFEIDIAHPVDFIEEDLILIDHFDETSAGSEEADSYKQAPEETSILDLLESRAVLPNQLEIVDTEETEVNIPVEDIKKTLAQLAELIEDNEPEIVENGADILDKIADVSVKSKDTDSLNPTTAIEEQKELEQLFAEIFDTMSLEYTPEFIEAVVRYWVRLNLGDRIVKQVVAKEDSVTGPQDSGTHEVINAFLACFGVPVKEPNNVYIIGKSALRLYRFRLAA